MVQANVALERELRRNTFFTIDYTVLRGTDMWRARNVNAPLPGSIGRPDANAGDVMQLESSGMLRSQALALTFRGRVQEVKGTIQIYGGQGDRYRDRSIGAASGQLKFERGVGAADFDRRHRFNMAGTYASPDARWRLGVRASMSSGAPFEITTGFDDHGDGIANDRPSAVTRNAGRGPAFAQVDVRLSKLLLLPKIFPERESDGLEDNFELNRTAAQFRAGGAAIIAGSVWPRRHDHHRRRNQIP